jgi:glycosyltransferase involved in cell wall biosynthesis
MISDNIISNNIISDNMISDNKISDNMVTFIIPTIARQTLKNTLISLQNQTIQSWKAIVIFDGCEQNIDNIDDRITVIVCNKIGKNINNAGLVRNHGIQFVNTKWIAFLDDDDTIDCKYLEKFYEELELNSNLDVLIFRMKHKGRVIPSITTKNFYINDVGISFIMKKQIFDNGITFIPNNAEDFLLLNRIRKKNYKIIISPFVLYYVKNSIHNDDIIGNRVYINYKNNQNTLINHYIMNLLNKK